MKRPSFRNPLVCIFVLLMLSAPGALAQESQVWDSLTVESRILGKPNKYALYLPNGYDSTKQYHVLYLLHGGNGRQTDWISAGDMQRATDKAIKEKRIPAVVV